MNANINTALVAGLVAAVVLVLLFGGGPMTGTMMGGGTMGSGWMGGTSWMWIPALLILVVGVLVGFALFRKKA